MSMLRHRKKSPYYGVEIIKKLDSFPKVNKEDFIEKSRVGGTVTVIAYILILWIIVHEVRYYFESHVDFKFMPDKDYDAKLRLNLDLTVAMPCSSIGADILDSTNQNVLKFGKLDMMDTWFEMTPEQRLNFDDIRRFNSYLREEFHAINDLLWKSGHSMTHRKLPQRETNDRTPPDACRVYGSLVLNKVAGNFHITAGKSLHLPEGHVHISAFVSQAEYNFSHRIDHLSFGDSGVGIIHPLDGEEKIADINMALYQYFVEIVPTDVETFLSKAKTYQYSVKDNLRLINHDRGSHGVPGIFFKYDISALKVVVTQSHEPLLKFFIRLSSTLSGVFVSAGILKDCILFLTKRIERTLYPEEKKNGISVEKSVPEEVYNL